MPGGGLSSAESVHRTPYGWAASAWRLGGGGRLELDVVVPVGARARVRLPGSTLSTYPRTVFDTPTPPTYWTVVPMFVSCRSYWGIRP